MLQTRKVLGQKMPVGGGKIKMYSLFFRVKKFFWNVKEGWKCLLSCLWVSTSIPLAKTQLQKPSGRAAFLLQSKWVWVAHSCRHNCCPKTLESPSRFLPLVKIALDTQSTLRQKHKSNLLWGFLYPFMLLLVFTLSQKLQTGLTAEKKEWNFSV